MVGATIIVFEHPPLSAVPRPHCILEIVTQRGCRRIVGNKRACEVVTILRLTVRIEPPVKPLPLSPKTVVLCVEWPKRRIRRRNQTIRVPGTEQCMAGIMRIVFDSTREV